MRKVKLQMQVSVDGFVSTGPNDEQKWVTWAWDEIKDHVLDTVAGCDTIIIGRKLAVDFIPYWLGEVTKPEAPMYELAMHMVRCRKLIFTKTLQRADWDNTQIVGGNLIYEIRNLKAQRGNEKDIFVCGGSSFVASLINENLIDELNLFINPVAIGSGDSIFSGTSEFKRLKLNKSVAYDSGIVLNQYQLHAA